MFRQTETEGRKIEEFVSCTQRHRNCWGFLHFRCGERDEAKRCRKEQGWDHDLETLRCSKLVTNARKTLAKSSFVSIFTDLAKWDLNRLSLFREIKHYIQFNLNP